MGPFWTLEVTDPDRLALVSAQGGETSYRALSQNAGRAHSFSIR